MRLKFGLAALILELACGPALAARACREHGGAMTCSPDGYVICKDGAVDRQFSCSVVTRGKQNKKVLKLKKHTERGQILSPGETPPAQTLEESTKEMKTP